MIPDPERVQGKISLAVTPRFSDTFLGSLMMKFGEVYPKIKLQAISMSHDKIFQQLQSGNDNFDLAIVNLLNVVHLILRLLWNVVSESRPAPAPTF